MPGRLCPNGTCAFGHHGHSEGPQPLVEPDAERCSCVTLRRGALEDLAHAVDQRLPPIAFVRTGLLSCWSRDTQHAPLISGYDDDELLINDPAFLTAPQRVSSKALELAWDEFDNRYAMLQPRAEA